MADPQVMREALADALEPLGYQVSAYALSNPTPPCVFIASGPVNYDEAMGRAHDAWAFTVVCLVGYVHDIGAQLVLDRMLMSHGETSIKALIEREINGARRRTLGGAVISASVVSATGHRPYELEGQAAIGLGAEFTVHIAADGRE